MPVDAVMPTRPKIFLTRELPPKTMELLHREAELTMNPDDRVLSRDEIVAGVRGVDGLLCLLTDSIDAEIMDANPSLKVIANFAVGFNNIDVEAASARKIPVTNTPGVLTETTADMAWALLMDAARRVAEGDRFVRTRKWQGWGPLQLLGADVTGATHESSYGQPRSTTIAPAVRMRVRKYGRTTEETSGRVQGINATVNVGYDTGVARFVGQIVIGGGGFSAGGDSGSLVVVRGGADDRSPVGLLFAGGGGTTIANPIDDVLSAFGVTIVGN